MITILVAEDQELLRGALVDILSRQDDFEVVAECSTGDQILPMAAAIEPNVAVLDIELPGVNGLDAAKELSQQHPGTRVLMLTVFSRPGYLRRALQQGAISFILKDKPPAQLVSAIRRTANGERVVDSDLAVAALTRGDSPLTPRETEVLVASKKHSRTSDIAATLSLSEGSVRNLLSSAIQRMDATNRGEAVAIAEENGWL